VALRSAFLAFLLSAFAAAALPRPAAADCLAPCSAWLCGSGATSVLVGSPIAAGTIRVDELWGAPTTTVQVSDPLGPSPLLEFEEGERAYLVFEATRGPWAGFNLLVVDAEGDVACPEGPLPLSEAVAISTSSDCHAAATRAGFGDGALCDDVVESPSICAAGGSGGDLLTIAAAAGLLALGGRRRRLS